MNRPNVPAVDELEAVINDLAETEKALSDLKERLGEVVKDIAQQVSQEEFANALNYLYWTVPELTSNQISQAFLGVDHRKPQFREYIKTQQFDFKCERCGTRLEVASRTEVSKYLRILRDEYPRWAEGYRLVCDVCSKEIFAERDHERRLEERATEQRMQELRHRLEELRRMPYKDYLSSPEWKSRRQHHLMSVGYRCQVCNSKNARLNVHHRTYERRGEELYQDLIVLCEKCHELFHKQGKLAHER